nr:fructose-bisphosphatase class III [Mediterraneibacter faecis]
MNLKVVNKKVYVVSDIHNDADRFKLLLEKIDFAEDDILILAGDIFDRGNQPSELYFEILKHPNIQVIQGNHDVWLAREIMEKYAGEKVGEYISYNTLSIMEQRMTAVDLLNLARWIKEKPYYINLDLEGRKYQIAHAQTYLTPERIWNKSRFYMGMDITSVLSEEWKNIMSLPLLWDILRQRIERYGHHRREGRLE